MMEFRRDSMEQINHSWRLENYNSIFVDSQLNQTYEFDFDQEIKANIDHKHDSLKDDD